MKEGTLRKRPVQFKVALKEALTLMDPKVDFLYEYKNHFFFSLIHFYLSNRLNTLSY